MTKKQIDNLKIGDIIQMGNHCSLGIVNEITVEHVSLESYNQLVPNMIFSVVFFKNKLRRLKLIDKESLTEPRMIVKSIDTGQGWTKPYYEYVKL